MQYIWLSDAQVELETCPVVSEWKIFCKMLSSRKRNFPFSCFTAIKSEAVHLSFGAVRLTDMIFLLSNDQHVSFLQSKSC
jgi:hypothetical protein